MEGDGIWIGEMSGFVIIGALDDTKGWKSSESVLDQTNSRLPGFNVKSSHDSQLEIQNSGLKMSSYLRSLCVEG